MPDDRADPGRPFDDVTDGELLEAAEAALAALALGTATCSGRYRRAFLQREGRPPTPQEVVGSAARATGFGCRRRRSGAPRDSRLLARAARAYVARTSGRRTPAED